MTLQYSPLCDTSYEAYSEYLSAVKLGDLRALLGDGVCDKLLVDGKGVFARIAEFVGGCKRWHGLDHEYGNVERGGTESSHIDWCCGRRGVNCESRGFIDSSESLGVVGENQSRVSGVGEKCAGRGTEHGVSECHDSQSFISKGSRLDKPVLDGNDLKTERGRHWAKNKAKREKKKRMNQFWRLPKVDGSGGCVSEGSTASVCTVDTRTAVEIQAVQSLAARRVVENEIAIARGRIQLKGFSDKAKTEALQRLAAARMEQRINEAKAKSQASFKKCDESLKSLGSTGSAGEFAMRCEVQKARRSEDMLKYVQEQADLLAKYASPEVLAMCREIKPPAPIDIFEIFGECSSDLSPEEVTGYYEELQRMQEEEDERSAVYY